MQMFKSLLGFKFLQSSLKFLYFLCLIIMAITFRNRGINYRISSSISLVTFSVSDREISEIFHEKRGSSHSQGFVIQKQFLNLVVLLFFADNTSSVGRCLTFRVSAYR